MRYSKAQMAKKPSEKSSWKCEHGCKPSKTPCKHLERVLRPVMDGTMSLERRQEVYELVMRQPGNSEQISRLTDSLHNYGLKDYEIDLIIDRYVGNLSLRELAKVHGFLSHMAVIRLLNDLTDRLKKSDKFKAFLKGRIYGQ